MLNTMNETYNPRLVRDWIPKQPNPLPTNQHFPSFGKKIWTIQQREWLSENFADCENDQLALAINCDLEDIRIVARRMSLRKSDEFKMWAKRRYDPPDPSCPPGFHWETELERRKRMEQRRQMDLETAKHMAKRFDFCTHEEKRRLVAVMYEAMVWARQA